MDRSSESVKQYAEAVLQLGRETGITTVDVYDGLSKEENLKQFFWDGLHFTRAGSEFLARQLIPVLETKLGLIHARYVFPESVTDEESFELV